MDGILAIEGQPQTLTDEGWEGSYSGTMNTLFPIRSSEVGDPVCIAFDTAEKELGKRATVIQRPTPAKWPGAKE